MHVPQTGAGGEKLGWFFATTLAPLSDATHGAGEKVGNHFATWASCQAADKVVRQLNSGEFSYNSGVDRRAERSSTCPRDATHETR